MVPDLTDSTFIVKGVVQGVGFRYHVKMLASALELAGHAINLEDGSVQVRVCGPAEKIGLFRTMLAAKGPSMGRIDEIKQVSRSPCTDCPKGFEVG